MWPLLRGAGVVLGKVGRGVGKGIAYPFRGRPTGFFTKSRNAAGKKVMRPEIGPSIASNILNHAWQADAALGALERITDRWLPRSVVGVSVRIWGCPQSSMTNLFYLACAVASNANPDLFRGARSHVFAVSILPHAKFVQVNIVHSAGGLLGSGGTLGRAAVKAPVPDSYYADKVWPMFLTDSVDGNTKQSNDLNKSVAAITRSSGPPALIASNLVAGNPVPQLDSISRQSDITALIAAALIGFRDPVPCPTTQNYASTPPNNGLIGPNALGPTARSVGEGDKIGSVNDTKLVDLQVVPGGAVVKQKC